MSHKMTHDALLSGNTDLFSEKLFQSMSVKPVSKWEMPVGNSTVWNTVLAQMVPWEPTPFLPPMTHSQPFSHQQDQDDTSQEPSLLIWSHLSLIQVQFAEPGLLCPVHSAKVFNNLIQYDLDHTNNSFIQSN